MLEDYPAGGTDVVRLTCDVLANKVVKIQVSSIASGLYHKGSMIVLPADRNEQNEALPITPIIAL